MSYTIVALIFLSPLVGYTCSAVLNNRIHLRFGQRGVAFICPICHLVAYVVAALHPPFPVLVIIFILAGFGNGLEDAAWNAWVGPMANCNEVLGVLHGFYGLGATVSPLVATALITKVHRLWYEFYWIMVCFQRGSSSSKILIKQKAGLAAIELAISASSFWGSTGTHFRARHPRTTNAKGNRMREALITMPSARVTWITTFFLLLYIWAPR